MLGLVAVEIDDTALAEMGVRTATLAARGAPRVPSSELQEGLRLGHFRIEKKLGAGGMGEVYLATDLALDRPVAIKVLPESSTSGAARERLIREARAQARIHHPNVAHIYFIGEDAGRLYFAMELLAGQTLADRVSTGPLSVEAAIAAIRATALGLREAHRAGFTHRDVKPSNVMTDAHGTVKVLDFGLVAAAPTATAASSPVEQTSMGGTPLYMAPEQARGDAVDLRADIYALGATLYHLVSGKPPFAAESIADLATLHATAARPAVPRKGHARPVIAALDPLIAKMMAPEPGDRFASYDDLIRELDLISTQRTRPAGFWARSIAVAIDFLIVTLLTVLLLLPFTAGNVDGEYVIAVLFVYTIVTTVRWGATGGEALLELEVVAVATEARPRLPAVFVRQIIIFGPVLACVILPIDRLPRLVYVPTLILAVGFPALGLFHAAWQIAGKRPVWDRLAGTQVRYRAARRELLP